MIKVAIVLLADTESHGAIGGLVAANAQLQPAVQQAQVAAQGYTCPVTGEDLPCPKCCVLNQGKAE